MFITVTIRPFLLNKNAKERQYRVDTIRLRLLIIQKINAMVGLS